MTYVAKKNEAYDEKQVMQKVISAPLTLPSLFVVTTEAMDEPKKSNYLRILDENIEPKVKLGDEPKVEPENAQKAKMEESEKHCEKMCKEKMFNLEKQVSAIGKLNEVLDKQGSLPDEPENRMVKDIIIPLYGEMCSFVCGDNESLEYAIPARECRNTLNPESQVLEFYG
eukprot:7018625-Ditylum_brightwellii.AAC.1